MLDYFTPLRLPSFTSLKHLEGTGNFAISKYYKFPYRFFYRYKLKMVLNLMPKNRIHHNILDFGAGPGIFQPELKKRALFVRSFDLDGVIDKRWRFEAIVCSSVLEFCDLSQTLPLLKSILKGNGKIYVVSPMETFLTKSYFSLIKNNQQRNSHSEIISEISKHFKLEKQKQWMNLYFALRASQI